MATVKSNVVSVDEYNELIHQYTLETCENAQLRYDIEVLRDRVSVLSNENMELRPGLLGRLLSKLMN